MLNPIQFGAHRAATGANTKPQESFYPKHKGPRAMVDTDTGERLTHEDADEAQNNPGIYTWATYAND